MQQRFEIRLSRTPSADSDDPDLLLAADVLAQVGREEPQWGELSVRRCTVAGSDPMPDGDIHVTGTVMDLPPRPHDLAPGWELLLFHICAVPNPDHVEAWMERSREITEGRPLSALLWFELDDAITTEQGWGEVHLTAIQDAGAVADLLADPLWISSQPLLEATVAPHHQLITRPTINRFRVFD